MFFYLFSSASEEWRYILTSSGIKINVQTLFSNLSSMQNNHIRSNISPRQCNIRHSWLLMSSFVSSSHTGRRENPFYSKLKLFQLRKRARKRINAVCAHHNKTDANMAYLSNIWRLHLAWNVWEEDWFSFYLFEEKEKVEQLILDIFVTHGFFFLFFNSCWSASSHF